MERHKNSSQKYKIVDLFCGCGGISRGLHITGRFGTQFGVELERHPASAFAANIINVEDQPSHVFCGNIELLSEDKNRLWKELKQGGINQTGDIDLVAGGPPCQGFSRNGVRKYLDEERSRRFYDDPRNHLYKSFLTLIAELKPKVVLIENVREFLNFGQGKFTSDLLARLDELGYYTEYKKLCAADFGVPQIRHRVFFLAARKIDVDKIGSHPAFPQPTHSSKLNGHPNLFVGPYRTVADAIKDLPSPVYSHDAPPLEYSETNKVSDLAKLLRNPEGKVFNHVARKLSKTSLERIRAVGHKRMRDIDPDLRTQKFYGSAYGRLLWDAPALTITTWVYHVGSGRFAHPEEDRAITMREAARLQSFDDEYIFPPLINPVSQMIGNAVPPLLAKAFGEEIAKYLDAI
jgi:DNA (cytosine-5)-methyltransferase 1